VHATRRMFQRHIGAEEVAFILTHGQVIERYDEGSLPDTFSKSF